MRKCEVYADSDLGAIDARSIGAYNFENKYSVDRQILKFVKSNEEIVTIKGYAHIPDNSIENANGQVILSNLALNGIILNNFWSCTPLTYHGSEDQNGYTTILDDLEAALFCGQSFCNNSVDKQVLVKYNSSKEIIETEQEFGILPIILMNKNIQIIEGDGSIDTPYEYTFTNN